MATPLSRRDAIKQLGAAGVALTMGPHVFRGAADGITIAGERVEIEVASVSAVTARITVRPLRDRRAAPVPATGELVDQSPGKIVAHGTQTAPLKRVRAGISP